MKVIKELKQKIIGQWGKRFKVFGLRLKGKEEKDKMVLPQRAERGKQWRVVSCEFLTTEDTEEGYRMLKQTIGLKL